MAPQPLQTTTPFAYLHLTSPAILPIFSSDLTPSASSISRHPANPVPTTVSPPADPRSGLGNGHSLRPLLLSSIPLNSLKSLAGSLLIQLPRVRHSASYSYSCDQNFYLRALCCSKLSLSRMVRFSGRGPGGRSTTVAVLSSQVSIVRHLHWYFLYHGLLLSSNLRKWGDGCAHVCQSRLE